MSSTKILYVITKSNWGGAQRYVYDLATNIDEGKAEVAMGGAGRLKKKLEEANIPTTRLKHAQREINLFKEIRLAFELLWLYIKKRPDIIHLNSSKIGGLGSFVGRIFNLFGGGSKIVFTAHGWYFHEDRGFIAKKVTWFLSLLTQIFAHKTIAVSAFDQKTAPLPEQTVTIYNGISSFQLKEQTDARRELGTKIGLTSSDVTESHWVGSIAELHPNKGIDIAIRALADPIFEDTIYIIIGRGEEREYLERLIEKHNISDRVHCVGYIDNAKKYLSAFDTYLLPSRKEGFPFVLLEAGIAKLPTIASDVGGVSEIIENEETGLLIHPGDESDIKQAVTTFMNNPEFAQECADNLNTKTIDEFSRKQMIEKTLSLYQPL